MPVSPLGLDAAQENSRTPPWAIVNATLVTVSVGLTPVQFGFGQPASAPVTVSGALAPPGWSTKAAGCRS